MLFSVTIGILLASALAEPSDAEYQTFADIANEVYYAPQNSHQQQRSGKRDRHHIGAYKLTTGPGIPSDQFHAVFVNDDTREVVLAIRGVDAQEKISIGMTLMMGGTIERLPRAKKALKALDKARRLADDKGYLFKVTGHSLGGTLAMLAAAKDNGNGIAAAFTFNASALKKEWFFTEARAPVYASFWRGDELSRTVLDSLEHAHKPVNVFETRIGNPHDLSNFCSPKVKAEELRIVEEARAREAAAAQARAQRQRSPSPRHFRGQGIDLGQLMQSAEAQQMMSAMMGGMRHQNVPQHFPQYAPPAY